MLRIYKISQFLSQFTNLKLWAFENWLTTIWLLSFTTHMNCDKNCKTLCVTNVILSIIFLILEDTCPLCNHYRLTSLFKKPFNTVTSMSPPWRALNEVLPPLIKKKKKYGHLIPYMHVDQSTLQPSIIWHVSCPLLPPIILLQYTVRVCVRAIAWRSGLAEDSDSIQVSNQ